MMTETIFVVDDDLILADLIAQVLGRPGRRIVTFSDPVRALAALAGEPADLIITDLSMPWIDGKDLMTAVRLRRPAMRIIVISGYPRGVEIAAAEELPFLRKPFNLEQLTALVDKSLSKKAEFIARG